MDVCKIPCSAPGVSYLSLLQRSLPIRVRLDRVWGQEGAKLFGFNYDSPAQAIGRHSFLVSFFF